MLWVRENIMLDSEGYRKRKREDGKSKLGGVGEETIHFSIFFPFLHACQIPYEWLQLVYKATGKILPWHLNSLLPQII